jgi:HEPN domain-containing protein
MFIMKEQVKNEDRVTYWLDLAQYDIETAEAMLKTERLLYVGFMCHQVIEKSLKALFVKEKQAVPPYSHNLRYLAQEVGVYRLLSENHKTFLDTVEPLNIESRYPDYKKKIFDSLTFDKSEQVLRQTKELFEWLRNRS